ncbi:methyltransferase domain-containing protein [Ovoidimarina sediminis]|uniref:methyltransferase domain-containing protein n=1 Tax=Ovoidimarina sediminis TaxID=3079856 RepID=UPI00290B4515|nr:methyltransferase domain-containing protein [Rhodophyticola sp. MJ-SS7]MDU8943043.1 methyltransferase domain-containing protein [Rhodophyticola sp. MJ-SS7]
MTGFYDDAQIARQLAVARTADMRAQRARLLSALDLRPGHHVLDLGSGNGIFAGELAEIVGEAGDVTGADAAPGMVAMARQIAPAARFVEASATDLPFPDGHFDRVTAAQVLCFVQDLPAALSEIYRVLAPNGRVALLDSDWASCVWHSEDPGLTARVMQCFTSVYADAHVARRIVPGLAAAGFTGIDVAAHVILNRELSEDSYAGQTLAGAVDLAAADPAIGSETAARWERVMRDTAARGEAFFSLNRYIFSALKPGT